MMRRTNCLVVLLLIGCPFMAVAGGFYYFVELRTQNWVAASGTVTGMSQSESTDSNGFTSTTYCPDVEFTTTDGVTMRFVRDGDALCSLASTMPRKQFLRELGLVQS